MKFSYLRFWRQRELAAVNLSFFAFKWKPFVPSKRKCTPPICTTWSTWNNRKRLSLTQSTILMWRFPCSCRRSFLNSLIGSLRSYDGNSKENVSLKLNFALSLLRLFHVDHVVQNRRSALACHNKGKEGKIYCCDLSSKPQIWKFPVVVWQTSQNIAPKSVLHVQHDYFSSFNQSNHWFVALSLTLPSSDLKLPYRLI